MAGTPSALAADMSESLIIPAGCREVHVSISGPSGQPLTGLSVNALGVGDEVEGYRVDREGPVWHLVLLTLGGAGSFRTADLDCRLTPGDVLVARAGAHHAYWAEGPWRFIWFHMLDTRTWAMLRGTSPSVHATQRGGILQSLVESYEREAVSAGPGSSGLPLAYAGAIAALLNAEVEAACNSASHSRVGMELQGLWLRVNARLCEDWTVETLAAEAHLSRSSLHRAMLRYYGAPPVDYLTALRMRRAEQLLMATSYPVSSISSLVGFATPFSFSRAFARFAGTSPSDYRKRAQRIPFE